MSTSPSGSAGRGPRSLDDRPAAGLYVIGWLLSAIGLGLLVVAVQAAPPLRGVLLMGSLIVILIGVSAAAGYQIVARRRRPPDAFRGPSPLLLFALQFTLVNAVSLALFALGVPLADSPVGFFVATIVLLAGYITVVWVFGIRSGALTWQAMALPARAGIVRVLSDVVYATGAMLVVALVVGVAGGLLARLLDTSSPGVVPAPGTGFEMLLVAVGAGVLIPIGEELFYRGYALTAWLRDLGPRSALWRSTVLFALIHVATLTSETFVDGAKQAILVVAVIGPVGYALGWLFLRRGLIAAIAGHAAFNLFAVLVLILAQLLPAPA